MVVAYQIDIAPSASRLARKALQFETIFPTRVTSATAAQERTSTVRVAVEWLHHTCPFPCGDHLPSTSECWEIGSKGVPRRFRLSNPTITVRHLMIDPRKDSIFTC
jgi:hypothetical protein